MTTSPDLAWTGVGAETGTAARRRVVLGGVVVDLVDQPSAIATIVGRAVEHRPVPLAVISANLDHVHKFGDGSRWQGVLEQAEADGKLELVTLLDGMPLVTKAEQLTGEPWLRLAGSDIIGPILDAAERIGVRVGFLGGAPETHELLREALAVRRPTLEVAGWWCPSREVVSDRAASLALAAEVAAARVDLLVVGLGKPRQELWIAEYAAATGAGALLAFGAVVDFLAEKVSRAPDWMKHAGLEWSYRLLQEPRRLYRRYLVEGPEAYTALRRRSRLLETRPAAGTTLVRNPRGGARLRVHAPQTADVTAVVVTHNNAGDVERLLGDLADVRGDLALEVVVVDNASTDGTPDVARAAAETARGRGIRVTVHEAPGNIGYAGGINHALDRIGPTKAVLVLNADLRLQPGSLNALWRRLWQDRCGVVAPRLLNPDGSQAWSLRFEPRPLRTVGDAFLGSRFRDRPAWSTETDWEPESYAHAHPIQWSTGACLLVRSEVLHAVGRWDERFFLYSEEVDFLRRVREAQWSVWYDPAAVAVHECGASGSSDELQALLAVNRVRYAQAVQSRSGAALTRGAMVTAAALRAPLGAGHRRSLSYLVRRDTWGDLPAARGRSRLPAAPERPIGSVVVPAHNEEAVIARTLAPLGPLVAEGVVELVVAVNGSTDATTDLARSVDGATVLDLVAPSKTAALNAADQAATHWPRLYLDADIEVTGRAVQDVLARLAEGDVLAARPPISYDSAGAPWVVRSFYRARSRIIDRHLHMWGAGAYAMSEAGHARVGAFPDLVADDYVVDAAFEPHEKVVVDTDPVIVRTPRTVDGLLAVLRRTYRGNAEVRRDHRAGRTAGRTLTDLVRAVRGPLSATDAVVYAGLVVAGRVLAAQPSEARWERDDSSRVPIGALRR